MPKDQPPGSSRRLQRCDVLSELRAFMSPQQLRAMPSFRTRLQARAMRCPISHPLSPPIPEFLDSCWTMFSEARASVEICKHKRRPLHFAPVVVTEVRPHETKQTRAHKQPAHETKQTRAQDTGERPHQTTQPGANKMFVRPPLLWSRVFCYMQLAAVSSVLVYVWFTRACFFIRLDSCPGFWLFCLQYGSFDVTHKPITWMFTACFCPFGHKLSDSRVSWALVCSFHVGILRFGLLFSQDGFLTNAFGHLCP